MRWHTTTFQLTLGKAALCFTFLAEAIIQPVHGCLARDKLNIEKISALWLQLGTKLLIALVLTMH